jgi:hypothetical protein
MASLKNPLKIISAAECIISLMIASYMDRILPGAYVLKLFTALIYEFS